ncbi:MAG: hypothetical protein ACKVVT_06160 [Dehalococcoidia bacterium]
MPIFACFVKFWPEAAMRGAPRFSADSGWWEAAGAFDAAALLVAATAEDAADAILATASGARARPVGGDSTVGGLPPGVAAQLYRGMGGWVLVGLPDQPAWLTLAMAFLRRRVYQRATFATAWHTPAVNELAALVFATHHADDAAGTCRTYGVPATHLARWAAEAGPSASAADIIQYGAVLLAPPEVTALAGSETWASVLTAALTPEFRDDVALGPARATVNN